MSYLQFIEFFSLIISRNFVFWPEHINFNILVALNRKKINIKIVICKNI